MQTFLIGLVVGLVVSVLIMLSVLLFRSQVERVVNQLVAKVKQKGEILEPENDDVENWISNLKDK